MEVLWKGALKGSAGTIYLSECLSTSELGVIIASGPMNHTTASGKAKVPAYSILQPGIKV